MSSPSPSPSSPPHVPDSNHNDPPGDSRNGALASLRTRPTRSCTLRTAARLQSAAAAEASREADKTKGGFGGRKDTKGRKRKDRRRDVYREEIEYYLVEEDGAEEGGVDCGGLSEVGTSRREAMELVGPPAPGQELRWSLREMWELASVLNFFHVFRPLLNIHVEFSAEEFETALIMPNDTLGDIHMPLLKSIPPITRMALTRDTWITVLARKLRDWWHWVAEGDIPLVPAQGTEIGVYKNLDAAVRVVILKALCDIRVEQEDIRSYIESSIKNGVRLSAFRKERVGGDLSGVYYWYEDDPLIGHRLYRERRKVEVKRAKVRGSNVIPTATYLWETIATNLDEFQGVSEKLLESKNRTEASVGKKMKIDMLPDIEKVHKRKERLLKKQHREALLLDNFIAVDGFAPGRSLRDRKPVTYTFDDYDRSINEAIKITKSKPPSPDAVNRRDGAFPKAEPSENGRFEPILSHYDSGFDAASPRSPYFGDDYDNDEDNELHILDQSNRRRRRRPQKYSDKEFVRPVSDQDAEFGSDDDIVGEVVYDDEYLNKRKQKRPSSSSEGDEEYRWDEENPEEMEEEEEEEEEEEDEDEDSLGFSDDSDKPRKSKKLPGRTRRETKLRSVGDLHSGLRRSKRSTRNKINYRQYEVSESETEAEKPATWSAVNEHSGESENERFSMESRDSDENGDGGEVGSDPPVEGHPKASEKKPVHTLNSSESPNQEEPVRGFLDLNELAPGSGFDDGPNAEIKDEDGDEV
ncbi:hypothetical protein MLD38_031953 [Melastoma candidum]|uniref:Uncharacterized protein n=1 Tax=Melastoma candidum TaxID=119954 RepID=A0ACB9MQW0_9MYRT|nr:hypothetical protein MLD38_031953 [Melastoma candidum]